MCLMKILIISVVFASAHCLTEYHCKPKSGCQISQCDPISYQFESDLSKYLETKEFPILCKSEKENASEKQEKSGADDAEFRKYVFKRLDKLENSFKDLTKFVTDLQQKYNALVDNNVPTTVSQNSASAKCKPPMKYIKCPTRCEPTCSNPNPVCSDGCGTRECVCPQDMVLMAPNVNKCVKPEKCKTRCKSPMVFSDCPSLCKPTCDNPEPICSLGCGTPGCVCPHDMMYMAFNVNKCLTLRQCKNNCQLQFERKCFWVGRNYPNYTFQSAKSICEKQGGKLALIYNQKHLDLLRKLLKDKRVETFWTGMKAEVSNGDLILKFADASEAGHLNWSTGYPKISDFFLGATNIVIYQYLRFETYGMQHYKPSERMRGFICEM